MRTGNEGKLYLLVVACIIALAMCTLSSCRILKKDRSTQRDKREESELVKEKTVTNKRADSTHSSKQSNNISASSQYNGYKETIIEEAWREDRPVKKTIIRESRQQSTFQSDLSTLEIKTSIAKEKKKEAEKQQEKKLQEQRKEVVKHKQVKGLHWSMYVFIAVVVLLSLATYLVSKEAKKLDIVSSIFKLRK